MSKKVAFTPKPTKEQTADSWVEKRQTEEEEGTDRLTIDIPMSLHKRFKADCAMKGMKMNRVILDFLKERYPA